MWPIIFTLVVENFGVKYNWKEHTLHLKFVPEEEYRATAEWDENMYIGITLK